mmetsp:Transcript_6421/g.9841  ORF Transcript_6421/g.9841 Transcript_6421/m.9841 type:complete len:216 (-) Transcript_6421:180-827(-)
MASHAILPPLLCLAGQCTVLYSCFNFGCPPEVLDPVLTKPLGRWTYLTFQSNILLLVFFTVASLAALFPILSLQWFVASFFPLAFALGVFLTTAYYTLDHFNPEQVKKRAELQKSGYPMLPVAMHLEHGMALPMTTFYTYNALKPEGMSMSVIIVAAYTLFYLIQVHYVKSLTGKWVYPFIDDITATGGALFRNVFFVGLMCIFTGLGVLGRSMV